MSKLQRSTSTREKSRFQDSRHLRPRLRRRRRIYRSGAANRRGWLAFL